MVSTALLQPTAGPSLQASQPLSPWCPLHSICHCASPYRPILQSFVYLSVFPRLSSGGQRYMNINSSSVPILETGTLRLRESITIQGHTEESNPQSECHPTDFLTKSSSLSQPSGVPQPSSKNQEGYKLTCQGKAASQEAGAARKKAPTLLVILSQGHSIPVGKASKLWGGADCWRPTGQAKGQRHRSPG